MLWNELSYPDQVKILSLIEDLLLRQTEEKIQDGLVAALVELETWDNSPCRGLTSIEDQKAMQAQLAAIDAGWD